MKTPRIRPTVATLERALHVEASLVGPAIDHAYRRIAPQRKIVLLQALTMLRVAREILLTGRVS